MQPAPSFDPNPLFGDSFVNSQYFNPLYLFNQAIAFLQHIFNFQIGTSLLHILHGLLFLMTFFFLTIIAYSFIRLLEIRKKEHDHLHHEIHEYAHHQAIREKKVQTGEAISSNPRWVTTLDYLFSHHDSDWKLAVIEADAMLEDLMDTLGFHGDTLGDKLKSATQDKFRSLTKAWEVHTIRNRIAHEGLQFMLSQHEAKRIIAIYEQIFREYGFI